MKERKKERRKNIDLYILWTIFKERKGRGKRKKERKKEGRKKNNENVKKERNNERKKEIMKI